MDYPFWVYPQNPISPRLQVLIPILMDYPLGDKIDVLQGKGAMVLIPILMDYPLGATKYWFGDVDKKS